jgi:hypothetical protein
VFGQLSALAGLILAGIPLAIAAVAWIQVQNGDVDPEAEPAP